MRKYFIADFIGVDDQREEFLIVARSLEDAKEKFNESHSNYKLVDLFEVRKYDLGRIE